MNRGCKYRLIAWTTCQLFCAAQLAAWTHMVVAQHGYCSTHGELIHLDQDQPVPTRNPLQHSVGRDRHVAGNHGCLALAFLMTPWVTTQASRAAAGSDASHRGDFPAGMSPDSAISILRQAPKASPPRG